MGRKPPFSDREAVLSLITGDVITSRRYKLLSDFERVYEFYAENHQPPNWFLTPASFEYAHTHGAFEYTKTHRFGVWEDGGKIVATACFEMGLGSYIPCVQRGYEFLMPEMLSYAERELSRLEHGKHSLEIFSTDEQNLDTFYAENGYTTMWSEAVLIYPYKKGFREPALPEGFTLISLEDENDAHKIDVCLWEGFDHGDWTESDDWADERLHMQSGPRFRKDLTTVVKAPNGDYACFAGMWMDERGGYAYLEPLATRPKYRGLGLASAALTRAMQLTVPFGAQYCYCGGIDFYRKFGCEQVGMRKTWRKEW